MLFFFSNTRRCHLLFQSHVSRVWDFQKVGDRDSIFFMLCIFVAWAWFIVQREKERDIISVDPDDAVSRFFFLFFFFDKASCKNIIHSSSRGNDPQTDTRRKTVINYKSMFIFCSSINSFFRSFVLILRDIVIIATSSSFFWPISTNRILYPK